MMKKELTKILAVSAISFAAFGGQAQACSTSAWDSATGQAKSVVDGAIRYEGKCAFDGTSGNIKKSVSGSGDTFIRAYVYADSTNGQILKAGTLPVTLAGTTLTVGGKTTTLTAGKWHQIQLQVTPTETKVWVDKANTETPDITGATGVTSVSEVEFGGASGGTLYIDSVVVSNGTAINDKGVSIGSNNRLIPGNSNNDQIINIQDVVAIINDIKGREVNEYMPDCNKDGIVNIQDVVCVINKIKGRTGLYD